MDGVIRWLVDRRPSSPAPTLVYNDYRLDNVMFGAESEDGAESACRIEAALDWEMATVGDPLADLGMTLCYWAWADASRPGFARAHIASRLVHTRSVCAALCRTEGPRPFADRLLRSAGRV